MPHPPRQIALTVNGAPRTVDVADGQTLLSVLRDGLDIGGVRLGCGLGQCGACTVLLDGTPARACMLRAERLEGAHVTTLEGLAGDNGGLHPVQQAFLDAQGAQCGYCLPGMVMSVTALLAAEPAPDRARLRAALRHNICRCGAHAEILAAACRAAGIPA